MSTSLFRSEAIDARSGRLAGTVIAAVPPSAGLYTLLVGAVALAVLLFVAFGNYASSAGVRGVVTYATGVARVYPRAPAETRAVLVRLGQRVAAGTPLVALRLADGARGLAGQIEGIDRQIAEVERQGRLVAAQGGGDTAALVAQRTALAATAASLERQRGIARDAVTLATAAVGRGQRLVAEGAGTQRGVDGARAELLARRAEVEALTERIITARASLANIAIRLGQDGLATGRTAAQLRGEAADLARQRDALVRADRAVLVSPVAGTVGDIATEPGRFAPADASLVTIVPDDARLELWFYATSAAVGFAREGQAVRLRFDAFPYQRYGSGRGTVTSVSRVAVDPATLDPALGITEPVFRLRAAVDRVGAGAADARRLRAGMTVSGDLVTERRPIWALLLAPLRESVIR